MTGSKTISCLWMAPHELHTALTVTHTQCCVLCVAHRESLRSPEAGGFTHRVTAMGCGNEEVVLLWGWLLFKVHTQHV